MKTKWAATNTVFEVDDARLSYLVITFLVKIYNCGVCGTDCHIFHGDITNVGDKFIPGHEAGGIVVEIGEAVTSVAVW